MIARLFVILPFSVTIPEGEQFPVYEYADEGYGVCVFPPGRSDRPGPPDGVDQIRIDGVPAFQADALRIDFHKESFDRSKDSTCDPPQDVIRRSINSFILRLRHVAHAAAVRPLDYPAVTWRIRYLNDDETELEPDERLVRGRGALHFSLSWIALTKRVWEDVHELAPDYEPPPWEELLLDAQSDLPRVGPAVVLASTALEVFISHALDGLAARSPVPAALWSWINQRGGDYLREPTVEEQYDGLLMFFTGHSLKTEAKLWESFRNLKTARNSFVHEGIAKIGGAQVSIETARKLVVSASEIVAKVREWLPQELHWPVFKHTIQVEAVKKLA
jgi:hypothetical protein